MTEINKNWPIVEFEIELGVDTIEDTFPVVNFAVIGILFNTFLERTSLNNLKLPITINLFRTCNVPFSNRKRSERSKVMVMVMAAQLTPTL